MEHNIFDVDEDMYQLYSRKMYNQDYKEYSNP